MPSKELAPTIYHLKEMIRNLVERKAAQQADEESNHSRAGCGNMEILEAAAVGRSGGAAESTINDSSSIRKGQGVALFCDFHAHSGKKNIFIYGCENSKGTPERLFPLALSEMSPTFSFGDCSFKVQKKKSNCGRIVVNKELGVVNSYTVRTNCHTHTHIHTHTRTPTHTQTQTRTHIRTPTHPRMRSLVTSSSSFIQPPY